MRIHGRQRRILGMFFRPHSIILIYHFITLISTGENHASWFSHGLKHNMFSSSCLLCFVIFYLPGKPNLSSQLIYDLVFILVPTQDLPPHKLKEVSMNSFTCKTSVRKVWKYTKLLFRSFIEPKISKLFYLWITWCFDMSVFL